MAQDEVPERDPWWIGRWARMQKVGNPTRKLILMLIAEACDYNTATCRPKQATLAEWAETTPRTVYVHLLALEKADLISRRRRARVDGTRAADEYIVLAPSVNEWPDGAPARQSEDSASGSPASRQSEVQASEQGLATKDSPPVERVSARAKAEEIPSIFPDDLRPHLDAVVPILNSIAEQHNAKAVSTRAVALAMMKDTRKPFVSAAWDMASWAADPPRPIRDVVATYRTWLDRTQALAGVERLSHEAGSNTGPLPENVTQLPKNSTASERRQANEKRQMEILMRQAGMST